MYFLGYFAVSLSITKCDLGLNFLGRPLLERLAAVLNVFHSWLTFFNVDFKLFGSDLKTLLRVMGSINCPFKITANVFPTWLCVNTHTPESSSQQSDKTWNFTEVLTLLMLNREHMISSTATASTGYYVPTYGSNKRHKNTWFVKSMCNMPCFVVHWRLY